MAQRIPVAALCCDSLSPQQGSSPCPPRPGSSGKGRPKSDSLRTYDDSFSSVEPAPQVEPWLVAPRYEIVSWLGHGSYGHVVEARDTEANRTVAIKRIPGIFDDECFCRYTAREVSLLRLLRHPGIVQLLDVIAPRIECSDFNEIYVVMEKCHWDLGKFCESELIVELNCIKRMMWTLLLGLTYLHSACVWHRDLKPGNCLLNEDCSIKIADFGLARAVGRTQQFHRRGPEQYATLYDATGHSNLRRGLTRQIGTKAYRAPELILQQQRYSEMVDIWSVGCIYAELLWTVEGAEDCEQRGSQLFQGKVFYPPSDGLRMQARDPAEDILGAVFKLIGTPSEEEVEKMEDERAKQYLRSFQQCQGGGFQAKFPHSDCRSIDFLQSTLCFNPEARLTARELLQHKGIFDNVRNGDAVVLAPGKIDWPLDVKISGGKDDLKAVLLKEICKLHQSF